MLRSLGMTFQGRPHSGLDDSKNTARLLLRMIADGAHIHPTASLDGGAPTGGTMPPSVNRRQRAAERRRPRSARRVGAVQHGLSG